MRLWHNDCVNRSRRGSCVHFKNRQRRLRLNALFANSLQRIKRMKATKRGTPKNNMVPGSPVILVPVTNSNTATNIPHKTNNADKLKTYRGKRPYASQYRKSLRIGCLSNAAWQCQHVGSDNSIGARHSLQRIIAATICSYSNGMLANLMFAMQSQSRFLRFKYRITKTTIATGMPTRTRTIPVITRSSRGPGIPIVIGSVEGVSDGATIVASV
jgi:hypothetical protein